MYLQPKKKTTPRCLQPNLLHSLPHCVIVDIYLLFLWPLILIWAFTNYLSCFQISISFFFIIFFFPEHSSTSFPMFDLCLQNHLISQLLISCKSSGSPYTVRLNLLTYVTSFSRQHVTTALIPSVHCCHLWFFFIASCAFFFSHLEEKC